MKRILTTRQFGKAAFAVFSGLVLAGAATRGDAGWNPFSQASPLKVGPKSGQLETADFNGDGHADILVNYPLNARVALLYGDGSGNFSLKNSSVVTLGYDAGDVAVGDVNGDQRIDLVTATRDESSEHVHVLLGDPKVTFQEIAEAGFVSAKISNDGWKPSLTLSDVNHDKKLDLIVANGRRNAVDVFYGMGNGQFAPGQSLTLDEGFDRYSLVAGDLNGDSHLDLVVACALAEGDAPGRVLVKLGTDKGPLVDAPELTTEVPAGAFVRTLCDIDADKRMDIALTHGESISVLVQGEDGKLAHASGSPFAMGRENFGVAAVSAGLAGNDVLVTAAVDNLDVIYADDGGQFRHACGIMPAGPGAYNVTTGDINGDGKVDVIANSFEGEALALLLGT